MTLNIQNFKKYIKYNIDNKKNQKNKIKNNIYN